MNNFYILLDIYLISFALSYIFIRRYDKDPNARSIFFNFVPLANSVTAIVFIAIIIINLIESIPTKSLIRKFYGK